MQEPLDNNEDQINDLRTENEIKKIKLSLEHGGDFSALEDTGLPPELESQWLDYIQQFEDAFAKKETVKIFEYLAEPLFKDADGLDDAEITVALDEAMTMMKDNGIVLETLCDVDDRELYQFVTRELMQHEINNIKIEGMRTCFVYEDFHPNHEYDIKSRCTDFVNLLFKKDGEWMPKFLSFANEVYSSTGIIDEQQAIKKVEDFRDSFSSFAINEFEIESVSINESGAEAEVTCHLDYTACLEGSVEEIAWTGVGVFSLKLDIEWWTISMVRLPGLVI